jgi:hypothetical protein
MVYAHVWDSETIEHTFDNVRGGVSAGVFARNQIVLYSNDGNSLFITALLQEAP